MPKPFDHRSASLLRRSALDRIVIAVAASLGLWVIVFWALDGWAS